LNMKVEFHELGGPKPNQTKPNQTKPKATSDQMLIFQILLVLN